MQYSEQSIRVLKGLEPVKERPGMYTRTTDPTHIIQEIVDNAVDEALAGFASLIAVTLHDDGSVAVEDNGRGIPVGVHPEEGVSTVEVVFTRLHAGGKFNKKDGGAYSFSGGLHGVGVSVTNALSTRLEVEVKRDGKRHRIVFSGGDVVEPLAEIGEVGRKNTGTLVRAWPDGRYFDSPKVSTAELERLLRSKAVLLPGLTVRLVNESTGDRREWQYEQGMVSYLKETLPEEEAGRAIFAGQRYVSDASPNNGFADGEGAAWAVVWIESAGGGESYVNLIPTALGGTHEAGLRAGLFESVRDFCSHHALLPRGVTLQAEDVWGRCRFILSARVLDPQFQGQTKDKLTSRDAMRLVSSSVKDPFDIWLNAHPDEGKRIADLAIKQALARTRAGKVVEKRKSSGVAVLPGKLTDCESTDISRNEIFLVEGDSAGGSAKQGRDKEYQAILPLRGKVLNTWEVDKAELFGNNEVHDIAVAIGVDPHGLDDEPDLSGLRYGRICIMSDADVDGSHIQTLLLTLFFRHFPKLVERGHVHIAQPPLFKIEVAPQGKGRPGRKLYALDEAERDAMLERLRVDGIRESAITVGRFKGLGEMNPEQLKETTMHPDTRRMLPVRFNRSALEEVQRMFTMLMGKSEASARREWMEEKGNLVEGDI
jgi:topoisomerase-4 subunit B